MKLTRLISIAVILGAVGIGTVEAQTNRQPREFPPASYKGKQYVDSTGCVFIRAGIDGNVTWVPRVSQARKSVCGFKPTLVGQTASAAPAPSATPPVQITLNNAVPPVAAAPRAVVRKVAPAKAPVVVRQTAPVAPVRKVVPRPVVRAVAPAPVVVATNRPTQVRGVATSCPGASALSQQYMRSSSLPVRCGPQAEPINGSARIASGAPIAAAPARIAGQTQVRRTVVAAAPVETVTGQTRLVPKHVAINRIDTRDVSVPEGYRAVWEDDRLNPYRAEQNLDGRRQMLLIWTQTVPRRLIDKTTGRDVTASVPLIYPFIDIVRQRRDLGEVTLVQRNGQLVKRVIRNANAKPIVRQPVYSSRSAPKAAQPQAAAPSRALAGKRFVQVGVYSSSANAQRAARQISGMGMPARIGSYNKSGKTYMSVQAGPFNGSGSLQSALTQLRRSGYGDAFARN